MSPKKKKPAALLIAQAAAASVRDYYGPVVRVIDPMETQGIVEPGALFEVVVEGGAVYRVRVNRL